MAITCPRCGGGIAGHEGATPCPHCDTWLFVSAGAGIPHRMVTSFQPVAQIGKAAADALGRSGVTARPSAPALFLVPYFLRAERGGWTGLAAASLPAACLETVPIYGAETAWFDAGAVPAGVTLIDATRTAPLADPDAREGVPASRISEIRHVPIAHVAFEGPGGSGSIWIDAVRGRVLGGSLPAAGGMGRAGPPGPAFLRLLTMAAVVSGGSTLLLPAPWGMLGSILFALGLWQWSDPHAASLRARIERRSAS